MRAMKDSGIEWIGEIPEEWGIRKLFGLLKSIGSGTTPQGEGYYNGEIPWLNTGDLNDDFIKETKKFVNYLAVKDHSTLRLYGPNSVVIAMYGATIGKLGIIKIPTTTNQACCVMTVGYDLDYKFLFYSFFCMREYMIALAYGAGQPNISQDTVKNIKIPLPSIGVQKTIVQYLDKDCTMIDYIIKQQQTVIEKLKEYKLSVITEAITKGLDPNVPMKDSGIEWIGKIPSHWVKTMIGRISIMLNGDRSDKYPSDKELFDDGVPFIGANNLVNGDIDYTGMRFISFDKYVSMGGVKLQYNDIIYCLRGATIGKNAISNIEVGTIASSLMVIRPTNILAKYLYYVLNSLYEVTQRQSFINGTASPNLSAQNVSAFLISLPPVKDEQQAIAAYLDVMCMEIDESAKKRTILVDKLEVYKKSLIYEAVTGKLEV